MLSNLRAASETWKGRIFAALLMGLIVISFAIFGVSSFLSGLTTTTVASVGNVKISGNVFRNAWLTQLQQLSQQAHRSVTTADAHRLGLDTGLLNQLINQAAIDTHAEQLGLGASDALIRNETFSDPRFKGPSGKFDQGMFQRFMQNENVSEAGYVQQQKQVIVRQQLIDALSANIRAPQTYLDAFNRTSNETRSIDYINLPEAAAGTIATPSEEELARYFAPRATAYRAPEFRKLVVLDLEPDDLAKNIIVTDTDVMARYEALKLERYTTPEKRDVQQITFPSEAEAIAADAKLKAGLSFEALATERKLAVRDYDLGTVVKGTLVPAIDAAAFAMAEGGTSAPVKNLVGFALVHVAKIIPAGQIPFNEVAPAIRKDLVQAKTAKEAVVLHDKIEDARTAGKSLKDAAAAVGLKAREIDAIDATGHDKAGAPVVGLPAGSALLRAAFDTAIGVDNDTIETKTHGTQWFELAGVEPARQLKLTDVHDKVAAAFHDDEITKKLAAKANDLVKQLDAGAKLADVAKAQGNLHVLHVNDAQRRGAADLPDGVTAQVFNVDIGKAGSASDGKGGRIVFVVLDAVVPVFDAQTKENIQLANKLVDVLGADITNEYVNAIKGAAGVKINQNVLQQSIGDTGGTP